MNINTTSAVELEIKRVWGQFPTLPSPLQPLLSFCDPDDRSLELSLAARGLS